MSIPIHVSARLLVRCAGGLACVLVLLISRGAAAQIVNVQALFEEKADPGPSGSVELSADWRTGSTALFSIRGALVGQWRAEPHTWLAVVRGEYTFVNGERIVSRVLEHLRYRYRFSEWLAAESFLQHEFDEFRRLQARGLLGAGPHFTLKGTEDLGLVLGVAAMLEYEQLRHDGEPDAGRRWTDLRVSSYALVRVKLMENVSLLETVYAQPRVARPSDIRLLNETALAVTPNAYLTLSLGFTLSYDAAPPATVSPLDTQLRTTLGLKL